MGDRVSISFYNNVAESVVLFSHQDGISLVDDACRYVQQLQEWARDVGPTNPLSRLEPATVMVDFMHGHIHCTDGGRIESNFYLGHDGHDGDNSDNGHYRIDLSP
jgi:hypothetical protein